MRMVGNSANQSRNKKLITATPRQLEAIIRLSEAHARLHYRNSVLREDVVEAVRLMNVATQKAATDPTTGTIDMDMITTGQTAKGRQLLAALVSELNLLAAQFRGKSATFIEIQRAMERILLLCNLTSLRRPSTALRFWHYRATMNRLEHTGLLRYSREYIYR